jgi:hypothetical protein
MSYWEDMKIGFERFTTLMGWGMMIVCPLIAVLFVAYATFSVLDGLWPQAGRYVAAGFGYVVVAWLGWNLVRHSREKGDK